MMGMQTMVNPQAHGNEVKGAQQLKTAALVSIIAQALGLMSLVIVFFLLGGVTNIYNYGALATYGLDLVYAVIGGAIGNFVIGIVAFILYRSAFGTLAQNSENFGGPRTLSTIGLVGYIMLLLGFLLFIVALLTAISCANSNSGTGTVGYDNCITAIGGEALGGIALLGLGALLAFIGWIGLILGCYRAGDRYDETTLKIGGILYIIPFASMIAPILVFIGASSAVRKIESGAWQPPAPPVTMVVQMPPVYAQPMAPYGGAPGYAQPGYGQAPPQAAAPGAAACPRCGRATTYVPQYNRNYCQSCASYV